MPPVHQAHLFAVPVYRHCTAITHLPILDLLINWYTRSASHKQVLIYCNGSITRGMLRASLWAWELLLLELMLWWIQAQPWAAHSQICSQRREARNLPAVLLSWLYTLFTELNWIKINILNTILQCVTLILYNKINNISESLGFRLCQ